MASGLIWQLKITLRHVTPPVWRRVQLPGTASLYRLHRIIQAVMPWQAYHLYEFEIGETRYGDPDSDDAVFDQPVTSARKTKLSAVAPEAGTRFLYRYDFGDNWEHHVVVEAIGPARPDQPYPVCLAGRRCAPPEDCGGPPGYAELLAIIRDPTHEEHDSMLDWLGGGFDPVCFDLEHANAALRRLRAGP